MQANAFPEILGMDPRHIEPLVLRLREGQAVYEETKLVTDKEASLNFFVDRSEEHRPYDLIKTVAVLRLKGYLSKRGWWWCDTSFDRFSDLVRFAVDDYAVDTILIDCDSPGGGIYGCPDCADVVYAATKKKRVISVVNDLCASACLWVGSAASEIVITQSGDIGSLGVYQMRFDATEALAKEGYKVEIIRAGEQKAWGSPYLPMSDDERKVAQAEVDAIYQKFIDAVARNRGVDAGRVRSDWADARIFTGQDAVDVGLADRVASFDQVLAELVGRPVITGESDDGESSADQYQLRGRRRRVRRSGHRN